MKNFRSFQIKYIPCTNTKPSRISIRDNRFNIKRIIPYNYALNNIADMAAVWLQEHGINIIGCSQTPNHEDILFTDNFEISIKG